MGEGAVGRDLIIIGGVNFLLGGGGVLPVSRSTIGVLYLDNIQESYCEEYIYILQFQGVATRVTN